MRMEAPSRGCYDSMMPTAGQKGSDCTDWQRLLHVIESPMLQPHSLHAPYSNNHAVSSCTAVNFACKPLLCHKAASIICPNETPLLHATESRQPQVQMTALVTVFGPCSFPANNHQRRSSGRHCMKARSIRCRIEPISAASPRQRLMHTHAWLHPVTTAMDVGLLA